MGDTRATRGARRVKGRDVGAVVAQLARRRRAPHVPRDALELILWENIGYLIDDQRRRALFDEFKLRVGTEAAAIARAPAAVLNDIAKRGGMNASTRVTRWKTIAAIVEKAGGDLQAALKRLTVAKARALLKTFPAIGDPGADKVLLFAGIDVRPALDSNGLRTMLRLGLCAEGVSYATSYRAATALLAAEGESSRAWFTAAFSALRAHGQSLCKRSAPLCAACPLDAVCAHTRLKAPC